MILIFISVITGSAWNILGGYTGQYSVGHAAYFGVGAYTTMILLQYRHLAPWYGIWAGVAVAVAVGLDHRLHLLPSARALLRPRLHRRCRDLPRLAP